MGLSSRLGLEPDHEQPAVLAARQQEAVVVRQRARAHGLQPAVRLGVRLQGSLHVLPNHELLIKFFVSPPLLPLLLPRSGRGEQVLFPAAHLLELIYQVLRLNGVALAQVSEGGTCSATETCNPTISRGDTPAFVESICISGSSEPPGCHRMANLSTAAA